MDLVIRHLGFIHLSLRFLHRLGFPVVVSGLLRLRLPSSITSSVLLGPAVKISYIPTGTPQGCHACMTLFEVKLG